MKQRRIILADDEPYMATILAARLRALGDEVLTVDNGERALALALQHRPHVVLCTDSLAQVSGYELSLRLRQHPSTDSIPVMLLRNSELPLSPRQMSQTNIRVTLQKPVAARELVLAIEQLIGPPVQAKVVQL